MAKINLYKIDSKSHDELYKKLEEDFECVKNKKDITQNKEKYTFELYKAETKVSKEISWNWILQEFGEQKLSMTTYPKAVLIIENKKDLYAITFGSAFFSVDKYSDKNFAFEFARRVEMLEIKTKTLLSPNMKRNKSISTYINYEELDFDSGDSFAKLKSKLKLSDKNKDLITETIEFGNSIKFDLKKPDVHNIIQLLKYVKHTLVQKEIYKIPLFNKVTDEKLIDKLDKGLEENISNNLELINISELDIIGVTEIFNNQDTAYELWYGQKKRRLMVFQLTK